MNISRTRRIGLLATAAFCAAVSLNQTRAQSVLMFEETPSIERLRSILIPESSGSVSRSIVIGRQPVSTSSAPVTLISSTVSASDTKPPLPLPEAEVMPAAAAPEHTHNATPEPARRARVPRAVRRIEEPPVLATTKSVSVIGFRIPFTPASEVIPLEAQPFLNLIASLLHDQAGLKLLVEGHTDAHGSAEYNMTLSKRRAESVASYLIAKSGVSADCLIVAGMGKNVPLVTNPFDARNRRVQFVRVQ